MVYIGRKNGKAVHHTSLEAMRQMDGIAAPEMQISDVEFEAAGGLVRVIDGKIIIGKTSAETKNEQNAARIIEIQNQLKYIDGASGRAARAIALAVASGKAPEQADITRLEELEAAVKNLRQELTSI